MYAVHGPLSGLSSEVLCVAEVFAPADGNVSIMEMIMMKERTHLRAFSMSFTSEERVVVAGIASSVVMAAWWWSRAPLRMRDSTVQ